MLYFPRLTVILICQKLSYRKQMANRFFVSEFLYLQFSRIIPFRNGEQLPIRTYRNDRRNVAFC